MERLALCTFAAMTIHKEGRSTLLTLMAILGLAIGATIYTQPADSVLRPIVYVCSFLIFVVVLQFFRSPNKNLVIDPELIIAPADGKVVVIEETEEGEFLKDRRIQISIFMSPINVHSNLNPVSGKVSYFKYHPGKFLVAWHPKASTDNERTTVAVEMAKGQTILFRQIAGALARRICWYVKEGQQVNQGEEFGFIKFGSRVDIFLPLGTEVLCQLDQKTTGGETVIARLR